MGGGKGGSGDSEQTIRYAPYLETAHSQLLNHEGSDTPIISFVDAFNAAVNSSPYGGYEIIDIDEGFFGMRTDDPSLTYEIKNYPSLWDMFGKFLAGLDVHDLWGQIYSDVVNGSEIENAIAAQAVDVQDSIDTAIMPKFLAGMRDINSVMSSTFVIGKAIIQDAHVREINKFATQMRVHAIDVSADLWTKHLEWNRSVIDIYSKVFELYYKARIDMDRVNLEYQAKDEMWNVNLFENARAILGAMAGSAATTSGNEPSQLQKSLGGVMGGAAMGAMITPGAPMIGAGIGAVLGLASSFL